MSAELTQVAPYPTALAEIVATCTYRAHEGWAVHLDEIDRDQNAEGEVIGRGLTLAIRTKGYDSYHPECGPNYRVVHYFIVPAATYNRAAWTRWLFEQFAKVELHECMEHFVIGDERPFAPLHGPGEDPYMVHAQSDPDRVARRYFDHSADES